MTTDTDDLVRLRSIDENEREVCCALARSSEIGTPAYVYFEEAIRQNLTEFAIQARASAFPSLTCSYALLANENPYIVRSVLEAAETAGTIPSVLCSSPVHLKILANVHPLPRRITIVYCDAALCESSLHMLFEYSKSFEGIYLILATSSQVNTFCALYRNPATQSFMQEGVLSGRVHIGMRLRLDREVNENAAGSSIHAHYHGKNARFGVFGHDAAAESIADLRSVGVSRLGFHMYPGTNVISLGQLEQMYTAFTDIVLGLLSSGIELDFVDLGGGFGIAYDSRRALSPAAIIRTVNNAIHRIVGNVPIVFIEPGRALVASAGVLVTTVVDVASRGDAQFVVVDAGMSHFPRPYIYHQAHQIRPLSLGGDADGARLFNSYVSGCTMASGDVFSGDASQSVGVWLPRLKIGDLLAILDVGAYGFSMSSNFSGLLRAPEVLVRGNSENMKPLLIRQRQSFESSMMDVPLCIRSV